MTRSGCRSVVIVVRHIEWAWLSQVTSLLRLYIEDMEALRLRSALGRAMAISASGNGYRLCDFGDVGAMCAY